MKYFNLVITIFCLSIAHSQNTKNTKQLYSNIYKKQVDDYIATWLDRDVGIVKKYLLANINIPYCCFMYGTILLQEKNFKQADIYITTGRYRGRSCRWPVGSNPRSPDGYSLQDRDFPEGT